MWIWYVMYGKSCSGYISWNSFVNYITISLNCLNNYSMQDGWKVMPSLESLCITQICPVKELIVCIVAIHCGETMFTILTQSSMQSIFCETDHIFQTSILWNKVPCNPLWWSNFVMGVWDSRCVGHFGSLCWVSTKLVSYMLIECNPWEVVVSSVVC